MLRAEYTCSVVAIKNANTGICLCPWLVELSSDLNPLNSCRERWRCQFVDAAHSACRGLPGRAWRDLPWGLKAVIWIHLQEFLKRCHWRLLHRKMSNAGVFLQSGFSHSVYLKVSLSQNNKSKTQKCRYAGFEVLFPRFMSPVWDNGDEWNLISSAHCS